MCVPRYGRFRACVVFGGAGEDFGRGRADEMHDPNKGMADIVKFFAAIKPYDGGKETE